MVANMTDRNNQNAVQLLTPGEAASLLGITTQHLARLADRGKLRAVRREGGNRRYLAADVEAILAREPWEPGHASA